MGGGSFVGAVISFAIGLGSLVTWIVYSLRGRNDTQSVLQITGLSISVKFDYMLALIVISVITGVLLFAMLGVAFWRMALSGKDAFKGAGVLWRRKRSQLLGASYTMATLLFLLAWALVALFAAYVIWAYTMAAADFSSGVAIDKIAPVWQKLNNTVTAAQQLTVIGTKATQEIKDIAVGVGKLPGGAGDQLSQELLQAVAPIDAKLQDLTLAMGSGFCPSACLDLSGVPFISGKTCVCNLDDLQKAQPYMNSAWRNVIVAAGAVLLMCLMNTLGFAMMTSISSRTSSERFLLNSGYLVFDSYKSALNA